MRTALTVAAIAVSTALAGPAGPAAADETAEQTIYGLQSRGYSVTIDRLGTAPMSHCVVTRVRQAQQSPQWLPVDDDGDPNLFAVVPASKSAVVSLDCTG